VPHTHVNKETLPAPPLPTSVLSLRTVVVAVLAEPCFAGSVFCLLVLGYSQEVSHLVKLKSPSLLLQVPLARFFAFGRLSHHCLLLQLNPSLVHANYATPSLDTKTRGSGRWWWGLWRWTGRPRGGRTRRQHPVLGSPPSESLDLPTSTMSPEHVPASTRLVL
jgi:hypothetical protein